MSATSCAVVTAVGFKRFLAKVCLYTSGIVCHLSICGMCSSCVGYLSNTHVVLHVCCVLLHIVVAHVELHL